MPVGVMYQSPMLEARGLQPQDAGVLDADRLEAHHERQSAGQEQSGERGDERLHVEVLDEDADDQADRGTDEDRDRDDDGSGETRRPSSLAHRIPVRAMHRADRQVDAAGDDDERHADREDQQVGVVEQQRRHVPRRDEVAEVELGADEQHDEDRRARRTSASARRAGS